MAALVIIGRFYRRAQCCNARIAGGRYSSASFECAGDDRAAVLTEVEAQRRLAATRAHLAPGAAHDRDELVVVAEALAELIELRLQEDEIEAVLQRLHLRIAEQPLLAHDLLDALDEGFVVALGAEDARDLVGVEGAQITPPAQVAVAAGRVAGARHGPAPDVVRTRRQQQRLARRRHEARDPPAQQRGVGQLLGPRLAVHRDRRRVGGVGGVDRGDRAREAPGVGAVARHLDGHPGGSRVAMAGVRRRLCA